MEFDVIDITEEELLNLSAVQMQLLREAQKKKNALIEGRDRDIRLYKTIVLTNGMFNGSILSNKISDIEEECDRQVEAVVEQLEYAMALNEPPRGEEGGGDSSAGYIVDYTLPYTDRYTIVRDYYMTIADPGERLALYSADETAKRYLSSYYGTLYNVLSTYCM